MDKPVFGFGRWGLRDGLRLNELQIEMTALRQVGARVAALAVENPEAEVDEATIEQLRRGAHLQLELLELVGKCIKDVPADWLVEDAPEVIDWRNVDSINLIRGDMLEALMSEFAAVQQKRMATGGLKKA